MHSQCCQQPFEACKSLLRSQGSWVLTPLPLPLKKHTYSTSARLGHMILLMRELQFACLSLCSSVLSGYFQNPFYTPFIKYHKIFLISAQFYTPNTQLFIFTNLNWFIELFLRENQLAFAVKQLSTDCHRLCCVLGVTHRVQDIMLL